MRLINASATIGIPADSGREAMLCSSKLSQTVIVIKDLIVCNSKQSYISVFSDANIVSMIDTVFLLTLS